MRRNGTIVIDWALAALENQLRHDLSGLYPTPGPAAGPGRPRPAFGINAVGFAAGGTTTTPCCAATVLVGAGGRRVMPARRKVESAEPPSSV